MEVQLSADPDGDILLEIFLEVRIGGVVGQTLYLGCPNAALVCLHSHLVRLRFVHSAAFCVSCVFSVLFSSMLHKFRLRFGTGLCSGCLSLVFFRFLRRGSVLYLSSKVLVSSSGGLACPT